MLHLYVVSPDKMSEKSQVNRHELDIPSVICPLVLPVTFDGPADEDSPAIMLERD